MQNSYYEYVFSAYGMWLLGLGCYALYWLRKIIHWRTSTQKKTTTK